MYIQLAREPHHRDSQCVFMPPKKFQSQPCIAHGGMADNVFAHCLLMSEFMQLVSYPYCHVITHSRTQAIIYMVAVHVP